MELLPVTWSDADYDRLLDHHMVIPYESPTISNSTTSNFAFDSLPLDVQRIVLDNLRDEGSWTTLLNLRLVNRKYCDLATPYVGIQLGSDSYKAFMLRASLHSENYSENEEDIGEGEEQMDDDNDSDGESVKSDEWINEHFTPSFAAFFCTVHSIERVCYKLAQPDCRPEFIKKLEPSIIESQPSKWKTIESKSQIVRGFNRPFSKVNHVIPFKLQKGIVSRTLDLKESREAVRADAQLAAVLATCTSLEKLRMKTDNFGRLSQQVVQYAAQHVRSAREGRQVGVLGKIKHLELDGTNFGITVADVVNLLSLPCLRELRLWGVGWKLPRVRSSNNPLVHHPNQNPIALSLRWCKNFTNEDLTNILAGGSIRYLLLRVMLDFPADYAGALAKHGQHLEFLALDTEDQGTDPDHAHDRSVRLLKALGSMRDLKSLVLWRGDFQSAKQLSNWLPPSLKELMILGNYGKEDRQELRSLTRHEDLPNLWRVEVLASDELKRCDIFRWSQWCDNYKTIPPSRVLYGGEPLSRSLRLSLAELYV